MSARQRFRGFPLPFDVWSWVPAATTLRDWQTAISATVGFCGVILTLLVNAHLARASESRRRWHDRMALRTAFETEFSFLKVQAEGIVKNMEKFDSDPKTGSLIKVAFATPVYDHNIEKISALTSDEIHEILNVYLYLGTVSDRLLMLCSRVNISSTVKEDWLDIPDHARKIVMANMKNIGENATKAIKTINQIRNRE
jgi:hypothetical protein